MPRPTKKTQSVIKPSVRIDGAPHVMETLETEGSLPTLRSIGFAPLGPGNQWVSYVMTSRGNEVISVEVDEPNMRQVAEESAKTNFVQLLMDKDLGGAVV